MSTEGVVGGPVDHILKPSDPKILLPGEIFWRDHQKWLKEKGYMLRRRYRPGWEPSWRKDEDAWMCDDSYPIGVRSHLLDATRIADGEVVMLKRISKEIHEHEKEINLFFSEEPQLSNPRNHCIPIYEVLEDPANEDTLILVMPFLRQYDDPRMKSIGEVLEFFRQIFEGLQFMHQCHIAHRDCMNLNIMMDPKPIFPTMYHPRADRWTRNLKRPAKYYTRTARPTKYFLIDFGLSRKYDPKDGPPRDIPIRGGDKTVPEFQVLDDVKTYDPFPTDIYYLGNMVREDFLQKTRRLEFIQPLVSDMVQSNPANRPTIDDVIEHFDAILHSLPWWKLRSRIIYNDETVFTHVIRGWHHFWRTTAHIIRSRSAIPSP